MPNGIFVCQLTSPDEGKTRHIICRLEPINDGMMFEYVDLVSNEVVGCVGSNYLYERCTPLVEFIEKNV